MVLKYIYTFIFNVFFTFAFDHLQDHSILDVIDLGYAKHKPTWTNTTSHGTELLNYNNIRYAESPIGWRRFRKPQTPPPYQHGIQDGNRSSWETDCISSAPVGIPFPLLNGSTWGSEDCLFLNVIKPKNAKEGDKLSVLHWVVGSAYAFAGKDWTGLGINTYGLYNQPLNITDGFIIVTHNYRYLL
jgi:carboxylesterase type B